MIKFIVTRSCFYGHHYPSLSVCVQNVMSNSDFDVWVEEIINLGYLANTIFQLEDITLRKNQAFTASEIHVGW